jgi:DNA-directed RNA polymerase subunit M/transcription elongation factor TFIIS
MAKKVSLSDRQKTLAAQMARDADLTCPECGSSEPVAEGAQARPDGGAEISMRCEDCEFDPEIALVLSPEEAGGALSILPT